MEFIETTSQPPCGLCKGRQFDTWEPTTGPMGGVALSVFYVRVAGTTGLTRHVCRDCLSPRDTILAQFVAPQPKEA